MISLREAEKILGVTRCTLYRYIQQGRLPAERLASGHYRVRREDVERLLP